MPKAVPILPCVFDRGAPPLSPTAGAIARAIVPFSTAVPRTSLRGLHDPIRTLAEVVAGEARRLGAEYENRRTSPWRRIAIMDRLVVLSDLRVPS